MNGQSILATFHSVSGATGRAAGVFDRATAAGADLAAAGFGSIESNAVQLGKALEDPKKGLTALAKSGVTFTQAQKDQIEQMTAGKASAKELADAQLKVANAQKTYNDQVKHERRQLASPGRTTETTERPRGPAKGTGARGRTYSARKRSCLRASRIK